MINCRCTSRPSLSIGLDRSINALGSGWRGGNGAGAAGSLRGVEVEATVGNVMLGLRMDVFIDVNGYDYTDVHSVTLSGFTFQPNMTSNPAITSRLHAHALVGRVAELGSFGGERTLRVLNRRQRRERRWSQSSVCSVSSCWFGTRGTFARTLRICFSGVSWAHRLCSARTDQRGVFGESRTGNF